jgi:hypothetical protein
VDAKAALAWRRLMTGHHDDLGRAAARQAERHTPDERHPIDAGERAGALHERPVERTRPQLVVSDRARRQDDHQHGPPIESGVDPIQAPQAADEEARCGDERQRDGDLPGDEHMTDARAPALRSGAGPFQNRSHVRSGSGDRRDEAEHHDRERGDDDGEQDHARVESKREAQRHR